MAYYKTCPRCGAYLDPGEQCDCSEAKAKRADIEATEKAALDAPNIRDGGAERENS